MLYISAGLIVVFNISILYILNKILTLLEGTDVDN